MIDIASIRTEYSKAKLDVTTVLPDPIKQFELWFSEAISSKLPEPSAMHLATVNENGRVSGRIVLLKGLEKSRFVFYTNFQSRKGKELEANPACSLTFFWPELERQVRIEGFVSRVDDTRADAYFKSRPRGSQVGAWSSPQSAVIKDRDILDQRVIEIEKRFKGEETLPRPNQWGGFEVDPFQIEFWQGRPNRLHDRILYICTDNTWNIRRLAP